MTLNKTYIINLLSLNLFYIFLQKIFFLPLFLTFFLSSVLSEFQTEPIIFPFFQFYLINFINLHLQVKLVIKLLHESGPFKDGLQTID